jgi:hypothetical protein
MARFPGTVPSLFTLAFSALAVACSHPLEIIGKGDITASGTGGSSCTYEAAPCPNYIVNAYDTMYTAVPRENYGFLTWQSCPAPNGNKCSVSVPASTVHQFWGQTMPALTAHFSPEVSLGSLSGDFAASVDCGGHVSSANPEVIFRYRKATGAAGEYEKQCIGSTLFKDTATGKNFLLWLDILHIDSAGQPVVDLVNGKFPIREIYASFADSFIVGKTYRLEGTAFSAGPAQVSIQITWLDIDANYREFAQCIVLESQSPIGAPTRRKTYCPRTDGSYEIKENVQLAGGPAAH